MERFGRETRECMLKELKTLFKKNPNVFVTSFTKLSVADLRKLRNSLKNAASAYVVVKNSIATRVFKDLDMNNATEMVGGMCGVVFVGEDPVAASKALVGFRKEHETLDIKGGLLDGSVISYDKIKQLSILPPREVLLGMVVSGMYSPVTGFVNSLAGIVRKFVYAMDAIIKEKGGQMKPGLTEQSERKANG